MIIERVRAALHWASILYKYIAGYLTSDGYEVKKARLELECKDEKPLSSTVANSLGSITTSVTTKSKLLKLFNKEGFNPSQTGSSSKHMVKASISRASTKTSCNSKRLFTIIDCDLDILVVPKEKGRLELRKKGRLYQMIVSDCDSEDDIKDKVMKACTAKPSGNFCFLVGKIYFLLICLMNLCVGMAKLCCQRIQLGLFLFAFSHKNTSLSNLMLKYMLQWCSLNS